MKRKYLLTIAIIFLVTILSFTIYNANMNVFRTRGAVVVSGLGLSDGTRQTFELMIEVATDVVVAEFVERRQFVERATEYEFIVHDRIFGNAADTIYVYVVYNEMDHRFAAPEFQFTPGAHYLLPLIRLVNIYSSFHYDGYTFISDLILDVDNPSSSTMLNQPLASLSNMNFNSRGLSRESIISYVRTLPRNPYFTIDRVFITSDNLSDIIVGSPYVLVIEITEPRRLASELSHTDISSTDIYITTVVEVLKGDLQVGDLVTITFFADTVSPGEKHIVSVTPVSTSPYSQIFTSSHSLHSLDQRDEIIAILRPRRPSSGGTWSASEETPEPSPTLTPAPSLIPIVASSRFTASLNDLNEDAEIELINIEVNLPEDFVSEILLIDDLNAIFLQEEMHSITVLVDGEAAEDILTIIRVYVGDLDLSDEQLLMFRGFVIDPDTGIYTAIPGSFSPDRDYFYFEFSGSGIIGAMIYELPTPLLRLVINQYQYYYRGTQQTSDAAPFITQNRTMVPIRLVSEALGATPRWDRATRTAYIYYGNTVLRLPVGQPLPDGMGTPELHNNRVLVPLRFVIENFEAFTFWDGALREVTVFVLPIS